MNITIKTKVIAIFIIILVITAILSLYSITTSRGSLIDAVGLNSIILAEQTIKRINGAIYKNVQDLQNTNWRVAVIWECSLKRKRSINSNIEKLIRWIQTDEAYFELSE